MRSSMSLPFLSHFLLLSVLLMFTCVGFTAQAAIIIDDFTISQTLTGSAEGTVTGSGIIGGERDVGIHYDTAEVYINSTYGSGCYLINTADDDSWGHVYLTYDGNDGSVSNLLCRKH